MKINATVYLFCTIVLLLAVWLFVGVFRDDEFYAQDVFIKYRPTFKVNFYSPIGMQDLHIDSLPSDKKAEELSFREFVIEKNIQNNSNARLWYLPLVLIQLTITFFCLGILKLRHGFEERKLAMPLHFMICISVTAFGIGFILLKDGVIFTIGVSTLVLSLNFFVASMLAKSNRTKLFVNI